MNSKDLWAIAKSLYAMEMSRKTPDVAKTMREERYQRTMSDEYPFNKPSRPGFSPVPEEQKEIWRKLSERRD